ncbi:hypothetical protein LAB1_53940 [Roseibium sp. LAB1]
MGRLLRTGKIRPLLETDPSTKHSPHRARLCARERVRLHPKIVARNGNVAASLGLKTLSWSIRAIRLAHSLEMD